MKKFTFEIRETLNEGVADISFAISKMLTAIPHASTHDDVMLFLTKGMMARLQPCNRPIIVSDYLNELKINGWTRDIQKVLMPYLSCTIGMILEDAKRNAIDAPHAICAAQAHELVMDLADSGQTLVWLLRFLCEALDGRFAHVVACRACERMLELDDLDWLTSVVKQYLPYAVRAKLTE